MPAILPGRTDIYALTDSRLSLGRPLAVVAGALLESGVRILQYREKKLKAGKMLEECRLLRRLTEKPLDDGSAHFQASTLALTTVDVGNAATNVIPGEARAGFNIRFNDLHSGASLEKWIRDTLAEVGGDYDCTIEVSGESFLTQPGLLSDAVADAAQAVTGRRPELSTTGGTSDARFIKNFCPVLEFGLVAQTMHKVDEHVQVADMHALTDIYGRVLERLVGRP